MSIDIADLRAKLAAATPGPWAGEAVYGLVSPTQIDGLAFPERRAAHHAEIDADTALIVAAVNSLPALLDELERLREVTDEQVEAGARALFSAVAGEDTGSQAWKSLEYTVRIVLGAARQAGGDRG